MTVVSTMKPRMMDWMLLLTLGLIWGASFLGDELALDSFGPMTIAALRIGLAAVALVVIAYITGDGLPQWRAPNGPRIWAHALVFAIFTNALPFSLLSWAQLNVSSGFAGITMAVVPLFVLPLAHLLVPGERMSLIKLAGFILGFVGVVILIGPAEIISGDGSGAARLACVAASSCYAIGAINTRLCPPTPLMSYSGAGLLLGAVILMPIALTFEGLPALPSATALGGIVYLGLFPTALATVLLVSVIQRAGPSFLSLVNYQVPIWAVLIGLVVLSEALPSEFLLALGLILAGLAVSQARTPRFRA